MANEITLIVESIKESDLINPTSTQNASYVLGQEVIVRDGSGSSKAVKRYKYIKATGALTVNNCYLITYSNTAGAEITTATPATSSVLRQYGIAPIAFTSGYYGFLQIEGDCTVASTTDTVAGNTGKPANGVTTVSDEGAATISASTILVYKASRTGAGSAAAFLIGRNATVA